MTSGTRFFLFLALSAGAHVLPWAFWGEDGQQASGGRGEEAMTLAAIPESLGDLVKKWEEPVQRLDHAPTLHRPAVPEAPQIPTRPQALQEVSQPSPSLAAAIAPDSRPHVETQPPPPPKPTPPPKPEPNAKPKPPAKPKPASPPRAAEKAKGPGQNMHEGADSKAKVTTGTSKREATALKKWGASIRSRVERQKRKGSQRGKLRIRVEVHTSGRLSFVSVIAPSGNPALDAAALAAVNRARLPKAPAAVPKGQYKFSLTMTYRP
ncbi:energy transducer TonB [Shimia sp. CNT1-13L.2]|uniref:energy transducer TonB family protein n=1 Tax=Shimia sp. CNT1-13L.2 TaxID=2959663 RepID=UPI0020CCB359|nr:energy transducer TonB [Shimia sp. CNT1-13L.2]MCP9484088.1 energy transducer TonB [Shimia sp. CNT1-13L.2]